MENHRNTAAFEAGGPQGYFSKKKNIFRYGVGEYVYQISGLYNFLSGQEAPDKPTDTHIFLNE